MKSSCGRGRRSIYKRAWLRVCVCVCVCVSVCVRLRARRWMCAGVYPSPGRGLYRGELKSDARPEGVCPRRSFRETPGGKELLRLGLLPPDPHTAPRPRGRASSPFYTIRLYCPNTHLVTSLLTLSPSVLRSGIHIGWKLQQILNHDFFLQY